MTVVMIGDFGRDSEGIYTYSVNTTTKDELETIISCVLETGGVFWKEPKITFKARTFHSLLQFYVPGEVYPKVVGMKKERSKL
jgi:hypothetical protein